MAVHTILHAEIMFLNDRRHLFNIAVASRAADPLRDVNAVIEVNVIGQIVNANPFQRLIVRPTRPHDFENIGLRPNCRMTAHACLRIGETGARGALGRKMAKAAVKA